MTDKNRGAVWPNKEKSKEVDPDFKGSIDIEGVDYVITMWKPGPDAKPRSPSLTLSVKRKDEIHKAGYARVMNTVAPTNT